MQAQSRRHAAILGNVAVARPARVHGIAHRQIDFEHAIAAAQVGWFRHRAAFCRARAHIRGRLLRVQRAANGSKTQICKRDESKLFQCGDSQVPLASLPAPTKIISATAALTDGLQTQLHDALRISRRPRLRYWLTFALVRAGREASGTKPLSDTRCFGLGILSLSQLHEGWITGRLSDEDWELAD